MSQFDFDHAPKENKADGYNRWAKKMAKYIDTGVKVYACYDHRGRRTTSFYSLSTEAQAFCRRGWHVEELELHGRPKPPPAEGG